MLVMEPSAIAAPASVDVNQQRNCGERFQVLLAFAVSHRIGEIIEQHMGFAVEDAIALQNGGLADGLCQMALARAARSEEKSVCVFR